MEPTDTCIIFLLRQSDIIWISEERAAEKDLAKITLYLGVVQDSNLPGKDDYSMSRLLSGMFSQNI